MKKRPLVRLSALLISGGLTCLLPVFGQMRTPSCAILPALAANAKRVVQYDWTRRIAVVRRGNPPDPIIIQVYFDSSGQLQRMATSAPQKPTKGIRGRVTARVKQDEASPVTIAQDYGQIANGPNMMKGVRVSAFSKDLIINMDSYDFIQESARRN